MYICPCARLCVIHVSSEKCSKSTNSRSLQSPFGPLFCFKTTHFVQMSHFGPLFGSPKCFLLSNVTLWTPFWIPKMLPFKQFCNFSCPKNGQNKVGHTHRRTDGQTHGPTHIKILRLSCAKSPFGAKILGPSEYSRPLKSMFFKTIFGTELRAFHGQ